MRSIIAPSDLNSETQKTLDTAVAKQVVDAVNANIERVTRHCSGDSAAISEQYDYASKLWLRHQDSTSADPGTAQRGVTIAPGIDPSGNVGLSLTGGW